MRAARWFAAVIIIAVGVAAFVLSFAALRDLAKLAHVPVEWAWLFPVIVDGTIIQATVVRARVGQQPQPPLLPAGAGVWCGGQYRRQLFACCCCGSGIAVVGSSIGRRDRPDQPVGRHPWFGSVVPGLSTHPDTRGARVVADAPTSVAEPVVARVRPKTVGKRRDPKKVARALTLRAMKSYTDIAKTLGVSPRTAANYARTETRPGQRCDPVPETVTSESPVQPLNRSRPSRGRCSGPFGGPVRHDLPPAVP